MKKDLTEIVFILDSSGSMEGFVIGKNETALYRYAAGFS